MSLLRLARLALLSQQQQSSACLALQHLLPAAAGAQHRLYQAAAAAQQDSSIDSAADGQPDTSQQYRRAAAGRPQEELSWSPQRSLPPSSHYAVKVTVKAHDLQLLKLASTVVRDLMLVHFAPKSSEVLPPGWKKEGSGVPYVKLALPIGDAAVPTKRTHWTVIRGPHVHKTSREQFARITMQRVITYATNNASELAWFLDSLKLYKFIGVELLVKVTSSSYLLPNTAAQQAAADTPLLAGHKQRFAHLFGAAAPTDAQQQQQPDSSSSSSEYAALQQSLQGLRQSMHQQLLQQRLKLSGVQNYSRWQETADGRQAAAAAAAAAGGPLSPLPASAAAAAAELPGRQLADAVGQQLVGSELLAAADAAADVAAAEGGEDGEQQQQQLALAAAIDKAMLQLKLDVLDRQQLFPYLMAFYNLGQQQLPAAEWMHAMLKYGKVRQAEVASSQAAAGLQAYQQLGQVQHSLLLMLLQQWHAAADGASRQELVLPSAERVDSMLPNGSDRSS